LLVAASLVLPAAGFGIAAAIGYRQHFRDGEARAQRNLGGLHEHALKVFETFGLSASYLDQILSRATDEQLRNNEVQYHAQLRALTDTLPNFGTSGLSELMDDQSYPALYIQCRETWTYRTGNTSGYTKTMRYRAYTSAKCWTPLPQICAFSRSVGEGRISMEISAA
jgi:TPR repeat protein